MLDETRVLPLAFVLVTMLTLGLALAVVEFAAFRCLPPPPPVVPPTAPPTTAPMMTSAASARASLPLVVRQKGTFAGAAVGEGPYASFVAAARSGSVWSAVDAGAGARCSRLTAGERRASRSAS